MRSSDQTAAVSKRAETLFGATVARHLTDKSGEKRSAAALELQQLMLTRWKNTMSAEEALSVLIEDYVRSSQVSARKGGVLALSVCLVATKEASVDTGVMNRAVGALITATSDDESRVRFYAGEGLFNVVRHFRCFSTSSSLLPSLLTTLSGLTLDRNTDVVQAASALDEALKGAVVEALVAGRAVVAEYLRCLAASGLSEEKRNSGLHRDWLLFLLTQPGAPIAPMAAFISDQSENQAAVVGMLDALSRRPDELTGELIQTVATLAKHDSLIPEISRFLETVVVSLSASVLQEALPDLARASLVLNSDLLMDTVVGRLKVDASLSTAGLSTLVPQTRRFLDFLERVYSVRQSPDLLAALVKDADERSQIARIKRLLALSSTGTSRPVCEHVIFWASEATRSDAARVLRVLREVLSDTSDFVQVLGESDNSDPLFILVVTEALLTGALVARNDLAALTQFFRKFAPAHVCALLFEGESAEAVAVIGNFLATERSAEELSHLQRVVRMLDCPNFGNFRLRLLDDAPARQCLGALLLATPESADTRAMERKLRLVACSQSSRYKFLRFE